MTTVPTLRLPSGYEIPRIGFGTTSEEIRNGAETLIPKAVELGYRLFDTAYAYKNEAEVGRGLKASGLPREELFVTTKLNAEWHGTELVRESFEASAERLGVDYVDLFLIHWPNPGQDRYVDAWAGMLQLREEGLARSIGVSNFKPAHLERLFQATGVYPEVNQIQLNPWVTRDEARAYQQAHGILTQSWSPLGNGKGLLDEPLVLEVAGRYGRTPAQVVLRWHMALGLLAVAKSATPERLASNIDVFDFELEPGDVELLSSLNKGDGAGIDSDKFGH